MVNQRTYFAGTMYQQLDRMLIELRMLKNLTHPAEKGREAEGILRNFLKSHLPQQFNVSTGFIINDSTTSKQVDIMICNYNKVPPVFSGYFNDVVPVHSVAAVIETKMKLKYSDLSKCQEDAKLMKKVFRNDLRLMMARENDEPVDEPIYIVFAYDSENFREIVRRLKESEIKEIDIVCSLSGGLSFKTESEGETIYTITDGEHLRVLGKTTLGLEIKLEHYYYAYMYTHLLDRINHHQFISPDYERWHVWSTMGFDFTE